MLNILFNSLINKNDMKDIKTGPMTILGARCI